MAVERRRLAKLDPGLPPGNRRLAEALRELLPLLPPGMETFALVAERAALDCDRESLNKSTVSRYFSGHHIAPGWFIRWLHEQAQHGACEGGHLPPLVDLLTLQTSANTPTACTGCNRLIRQLSRCTEELLTAKSEAWHATRELAVCRNLASGVGFTAGRRQQVPAPGRPPVPLPVPYYRRDRQAELKDARAAQRIAADVAALMSQQQHHEATVTLQNARAVLTPPEMASLVICLRGNEVNGAADTLLQAYGRDMPAHAVIDLAHGLLKEKLHADAERVLRAASGRNQDSRAG